MHHFLKPILRRSSPLCTFCYNNSGRTLPSKLLFSRRPFHTTKPTHVPIIPIPLFITGALKSGQLVSLVSLSSKTSLTLLPHTFRRGGKADTIAKAPNTSRLRLVYLSEEEEKEIVKAEIDALLDSQSGLVVPKDNEVVMWLQTIVNNLAAAAVDDIRLPVRHYGEETQNQESKEIQLVPTLDPVDIPIPPTEDDFRPAIPRRNFDVDVIWDSSTVNAMCAGSNIIVYNLLIQYLEYDTNRIAVILSHEIAHSLQRHFVEQRGFSSLMLMLGDITRGVFWMVTEPFGPYVNQKINEYISTFIALETETTYNRKLEKEV
ncbi:uncharacterized protein EV154DRAFT_422549 [Mucor mucedo]|uniref:uncharacterized protein n=1 Tax=Mucor mucedo TaxID=29922 RepID=UPI00221FE807|nr:uncharacterized protein EV154DRAFT_422549 [Mucor mucedo]KAI7890145.1 hypothetical protein EV154DRAFT_422549 [Mucor mucedo]